MLPLQSISTSSLLTCVLILCVSLVWAALRAAAAAVDGMVQYVRKNMPLISKELMSVDDVEAFIDRTDYSVIGYALFMKKSKRQ